MDTSAEIPAGSMLETSGWTKFPRTVTKTADDRNQLVLGVAGDSPAEHWILVESAQQRWRVVNVLISAPSGQMLALTD